MSKTIAQIIKVGMRHLLTAGCFAFIAFIILMIRDPIWTTHLQYSSDEILAETIKNILATDNGLNKFFSFDPELKTFIQKKKIGQDELHRTITVMNKRQVLTIKYENSDKKFIELLARNNSENLDKLIEYYRLNYKLDFQHLNEIEILVLLSPGALSCIDPSVNSCFSSSSLFHRDIDQSIKKEPANENLQKIKDALKYTNYVDMYYQHLLSQKRIVPIKDLQDKNYMIEARPKHLKEIILVIFALTFSLSIIVTNWCNSRSRE